MTTPYLYMQEPKEGLKSTAGEIPKNDKAQIHHCSHSACKIHTATRYSCLKPESASQWETTMKPIICQPLKTATSVHIWLHKCARFKKIPSYHYALRLTIVLCAASCAEEHVYEFSRTKGLNAEWWVSQTGKGRVRHDHFQHIHKRGVHPKEPNWAEHTTFTCSLVRFPLSM